MTKKKLKKYGRFGILLGIKESYLLVKNIIGLGIHPFKTLRALQREKDRSQQVLILGIPFFLFLAGLAMVWGGRRLLATTVEWGMGARGGLVVTVLVAMMTAWYLGYWLIKVWSLGKKYE